MAEKKPKKKGGLKNVLSKVASVGLQATNPALIALNVAMRKVLNKHQVSTKGKSLLQVVKLFFHVIIQKKKPAASYDSIIEEGVGAIVKAVIGFFKAIKKKKASGEKLSDTEKVVAKAGEQAEEKYDSIVTQAKKEKIAEVKAQSFIPVVLILIAVYFLFLRK